MKEQKQRTISNAKIAIVFFAFLALIAAISLSFKVIILVKDSQFDGSKRFTLSITNGKAIEVTSLSPSLKNITIFKLDNNIESAKAGRLLEIPIDGFIESNSLELDQQLNSLFVKTIFGYNRLKTNLTIIDLLRIAMFVRTVPQSSIDVKTVGDVDSALELDEIVGRSVSDYFIEKDDQTIQIINGTEVAGLGNRLARLITNMGGDVIIVATDNSTKKKSLISYTDKKTYTVERLQKVLGYEAIRDASNAISDITIIIGEDKIGTNPF